MGVGAVAEVSEQTKKEMCGDTALKPYAPSGTCGASTCWPCACVRGSLKMLECEWVGG